MNPMTNVKNITKLNEQELKLGVSEKTSWHNMYKNSAWIFVGGLPYELTEGDIICVFSQYGEIVNINLVKNKKTGQSKGYCFLCYENQKSTILAIDNFNGVKLCGRTIRVDHVSNYRPPKEHEEDDAITKLLQSEGCAPKTAISSSSEEEEEEKSVVIKKPKKIKKEKKKKKKLKKKKKKRHSKTETSSEEISDSEKECQIVKIKQEKLSPEYDRSKISERPTPTKYPKSSEKKYSSDEKTSQYIKDTSRHSDDSSSSSHDNSPNRHKYFPTRSNERNFNSTECSDNYRRNSGQSSSYKERRLLPHPSRENTKTYLKLSGQTKDSYANDSYAKDLELYREQNSLGELKEKDYNKERYSNRNFDTFRNRENQKTRGTRNFAYRNQNYNRPYQWKNYESRDLSFRNKSPSDYSRRYEYQHETSRSYKSNRSESQDRGPDKFETNEHYRTAERQPAQREGNNYNRNRERYESGSAYDRNNRNRISRDDRSRSFPDRNYIRLQKR